jgi:outer membrane lipoprotein carrier protein
MIIVLGMTGLVGGIVIPGNVQAAFTQKITNTKKKVITYKGSVHFAKKNRVKWIYTDPTEKEVCTDGKTLTVVDHDLEQVSYYRIDKGLDLGTILKHAKKYKDHIYLAKFQDKTYTIAVDDKGRVESVAYYDDLDNKVQILFVYMHQDDKKHGIKSDIECKAPKSYDIIRG